MEIYESGEIKPDVLESVSSIKPEESSKREALKRLDFILGFFAEQYPKKKEQFIKDLIAQYKELVKEDHISKLGLETDDILKEFTKLYKEKELALLSLNFFIQNVQLKDKSNWIGETDVIYKNKLYSYLLPRYYNLTVFIKTLGREEGIKLYKKYITHFIINRLKTHEDQVQDIRVLAKPREPTDTPSEWNIYYGLINDGKYFYRNNNCTWVEALADFPDKELVYLVCCYGDYEGVKYRNKHFILTMEHTIAEGDPYCSRVIHDTRVDYDLRHPSKEFWDDLKPEKK
ncbi:MAG: hypothetical protein FK733_12690 [Asgard group archaeon]|nr:hypothetical protein [Asgard group archaeon]